MPQDSKNIVRQWNREIAEETRRLAPQRSEGHWRYVVWTALWFLWLALLLGLIGVLHPLH